jgi:hypothetical protein
MPKQIGGKTVQITVRVGEDVPDRAARLARTMAPEGMRLARADVLRAALLRGLLGMEAEIAPTLPPPPPEDLGVEPSVDPPVETG